MAPIRGRIRNAESRRVLDDFTVRSLRSQRAFRRKPQPKKAMQVKKSGISVWVSLKMKPTAIGSRVSKPAVWRIKPKLAIIRWVISTVY